MQTDHHLARMDDNPTTRLLAAMTEARTYPESDRTLFYSLLLAELCDVPAEVWNTALERTRLAMVTVDLAEFDAALKRGTL